METLQACFNQPVANRMALAVHSQFHPQARLFVPTAMALTLTYRREKHDEEEEPVMSKHQIRSENGR